FSSVFARLESVENAFRAMIRVVGSVLEIWYLIFTTLGLGPRTPRRERTAIGKVHEVGDVALDRRQPVGVLAGDGFEQRVGVGVGWICKYLLDWALLHDIAG